MQAGDIFFIINENFVGEAIEFFDHGDFSHVCIAVSRTHILETDLMTNARIVPFDYKNFELVKLNLTQSQREKIPKIAKSLVGLKYNYLLIIYYILKGILHLKRPWTLPRSEICSELVDHVLFLIGFLSESTYKSGETPNMMYKHLKQLT